MADLWRGEVRVDEVVLVLPNPAPPPVSLAEQASAAYSFICRDGIREYQIGVIALWHTYSGGTLFEYRTQVQVSVTQGFTIHFFQTLNSADGAGPVAYEGGGVLAIDKDGNADQVRFETPLGTVTAVPSTWSGNDNVKMTPETLRLDLAVENPFLNNEQNLVRWNHFWGSQNGTRYRGAAMSAAQPGSFLAWFRSFPFTGTPPYDTSFVQEAIRFKSTVSVNSANTYGNAPGLEAWETSWNGGDTIPRQAEPALDLIRSDEHGVLWAAFATSEEPETLRYRRSHDKALTWTDGEIATTPGVFVQNPNLVWYGGALVAVWTQGSLIVQARSFDLGVHWEPALPILLFASFADNPRLRVVCDPRHGVFYYFVREDGGALVLHRSFDKGATFRDDPTGITVHAAIDDAILDALVATDSRVYARFSAGGGYETWRSSNWGRDWLAEGSVAGLGSNPRSTIDAGLGVTHHCFYVAATDEVRAYSDGGFGLTAFATPAVVAGTMDNQVADIEKLADGGAVVAYFTPAEVFSTRRSRDYARNWD